MAKKRKIRPERLLLAVLAILVPIALVIGIVHAVISHKQDNEQTQKPADTITQEPEEDEGSDETENEEPKTDPEKDPRFFETDSLLIVANKKHRLPQGYEPSDLAYPEGIEMRHNTWTMKMEAAEALEDMFANAENDGIHLVMGSGYRGEDFQKTLYDGYVASYGVEVADSISSRPGYSDHQTGLATDLCGVDSTYDLTVAFEETEEGKWLKEHAHEYGFIMRYPKGKEEITGYSYEPWHFRYIGKEEAKKVFEAGEWMTFEEYYGISGGDYE